MRSLVKADMKRIMVKILPWLLLAAAYAYMAVSLITGIDIHHLASAYSKKTYEEIWDKCYETLDSVSKNKFMSSIFVFVSATSTIISTKLKNATEAIA